MKTLPNQFYTMPEFDLYSCIYKRRLVHVLIKEPCRCGSLILFNSLTKEDSSTTRRTQPASSSPPPPWEPPVDSWNGPQRNVSNLGAVSQEWTLSGDKGGRMFSCTAQWMLN